MSKPKYLANRGPKEMEAEYRVVVLRETDESGLKKRQFQIPGNSFSVFVRQREKDNLKLVFNSPEESKVLTDEYKTKYNQWDQTGSMFEFGLFLLLQNLHIRKRDLIDASEYSRKRDEIERYCLKVI